MMGFFYLIVIDKKQNPIYSVAMYLVYVLRNRINSKYFMHTEYQNIVLVNAEE
jgi:hypothetical protein